jgi:hypothetical protein
MADHIRLNKDDDGVDLSGTVSFDAAITLAGSTMAFYLVDREGTAKINGRACTVVIDDPNNSIAYSVALASGDTDTVGLYRAVLRITFSDARVRTVIPSPKFIEVVDWYLD